MWVAEKEIFETVKLEIQGKSKKMQTFTPYGATTHVTRFVIQET